MISSSLDSSKSLLNKFQKHVPKILIQQLISNLLIEYGVDQDRVETDSESGNESCRPSIERFYGSLLFVDISGFTVLSQRLTVDKLRVQINEYFTKILNIVFKHNGDVLKFAGDALYIIWPQNMTIINSESSVKSSERQSSKSLVSSAVRCGLEITRCCSHCLVNLVDAKPNESHLAAMLTMSLNEDYFPPKTNKETKEVPETSTNVELTTFTFLDVHAGVSIGTMASMDVGTSDRWEHLIVGQPMKDVATAEGEANKGELVVCPQAHSLLHEDAATCECQVTKSSFFQVTHLSEDGASVLSASLTSCSTDTAGEDDEEVREYESDDVFVPARSDKTCEITDYVRDAFAALTQCMSRQETLSNSQSTREKSAPHPITLPEQYEGWINNCLLEDVFRHVHEADRMHYALQCATRLVDMPAVTSASGQQDGSLFDLLINEDTPTSAPCRMVKTQISPSSYNRSRTSSGSGNTSSSSSSGWFDTQNNRHSSTTSTTSNYSMISLHDTTLVGELRTVAVMFVGIHMPDTPLHFERSGLGAQSSRDCIVDSFSFLKRTESEAAADEVLLTRYQSCVEIMVRTLHDKGGQLRQFIVDDKGTVCIGTFGLRGSTNNDNAAAAIDAANEIILQLRQLGLEASIGLTLGKAYCGLVGSEERHEYSVMGPSTNLSARLMCSALPGEIRCGSEIRDHDRVHAFVPLGDISAKGYTHPVPTFKPLFLTLKHPKNCDEESVSSSRQCETGQWRAKRWLCFGRDTEMDCLFRTLLPEMTKDGDSADVGSPGISMLVLTGPHGIGKTTLMNAFDCEVSSRCVLNPNGCKVCLLHNPPTSHNIAEPLSAWKSILCRAIHRMVLSRHLESDGAVVDKDLRGRFLQSLQDLLIGLAPEFQAMKPLLGDMGIIDAMPDSEQTATLTGEQRLLALSDLLVELLMAFSRQRAWRVVLIFDDLHCMDCASLDLLHNLWVQEWTARDATSRISILMSNRPGLRASINDPGSRFQSSFLPGEARCSNLLLGPLGSSAIHDLATAVFARSGILDVDERIHAQFYQKSGGNPLYASELAKAVRTKYMNTMCSLHRSTGGDSRFMEDLLVEFDSSRIEEIICCRFDQLESACQLLLKMAAAACIHGGHFTLDMLVYVTTHYQQQETDSPHGTLTEQDADVVRDSVLELLQTILSKHEFVHTMESEPYSRRSDECESSDGGPELADINSCRFSFIFELEKQSVYDLMLASQKTLLHKFVALYLQGMAAKETAEQNERASATTLHGEACQWEAAAEWGSAMKCYYRAAVIMDGLGAMADYRCMLVCAHQMLDRLREAAGFSCEIQLGLSDSFRLVVRETIPSVKQTVVLALMKTKRDVFNIFQGDSDLLQVGVSTSMRLGRAAIQTLMEPSVASQLFEECMDLLALAVVGAGDADDIRLFGIRDAKPYYSVPATIFYMYTLGVLTDDPQRSKQTRLVDSFLALTLADPAAYVHSLSAKHSKRQLLISQRRVDESVVLADEVRAQYRYDLHHQVLCDTYMTDSVVVQMANNSLMLLMTGRLSKLNDGLGHVKGLFASLQDTISLSWNVLPYCAVLTRCGAASLALQKYAHFASRATIDKRMNLIACIQDLCQLWLTLLADRESMPSSADGDLLDRVMKMQFIHDPVIRQQPTSTCLTEMFAGAGPEYICAEVCLQMALRCAEDEEQRGEYLSTALKYANCSIHSCERNAFTAITLINSLLLKARILHAAMDVPSVGDSDKRVDALESLERCVDLAQQFGFHLVVLQAGSLMERLGVDDENGRALQMDAMDRIREWNEREGRGQRGSDWGELTGLIRDMPILLKEME